MLRFIEDDRIKLPAHILLDVATQERIGRDHQLVTGNVGKSLLSVRPVQQERFQSRREPYGLGLPIGHQTRRANHQRWFSVLPCRQPRERLDRFAQAHLVGQNTTQSIRAEVREPVDADPLVRPQLIGEVAGQNHFWRLRERCWRLPVIFLRSLFQVRTKAPRNPHSSPGLLRLAIENHFLKFLHGLRDHQRDATVWEPLVRYTLLQELSYLDRRQRRFPASILEGHVNGKPVTAGGPDGNFRSDHLTPDQQRLEPVPHNHFPPIAPTRENIGEEDAHQRFGSQRVRKPSRADRLPCGALRHRVACPIS